MAFQKFSKEDWFELSKEEQDFHTKEFAESVESRKRVTIIGTRFIAICCIFALFYIGWVQYGAIDGYNKVMSEYGSLGHCYYCGLETLRKCDCQYNEDIDVLGNRDYFSKDDIKILSNWTANHNIEKCPVREWYGDGSKLNKSIQINLSQYLIK